jgi:hypothetical protein
MSIGRASSGSGRLDDDPIDGNAVSRNYGRAQSRNNGAAHPLHWHISPKPTSGSYPQTKSVQWAFPVKLSGPAQFYIWAREWDRIRVMTVPCSTFR